MLKPRWLGLLGALVVILVAFTFLGLWQLSVARDDAAREAIAQAPAPTPVALDQVLTPHTPFLVRWQRSLARDDAAREAIAKAPSQTPVALDQVLTPHTPFPVEASGRPV